MDSKTSIVVPLVGLALATCIAAGDLPKQRSRIWDGQSAPKIVLHFQQRTVIDNEKVDIVTVDSHYRVSMGLVPLDGAAPLPPQSVMLCTPYNEHVGVRYSDGLVREGVLEIAFNCGGKRYLFTKLDISEAP